MCVGKLAKLVLMALNLVLLLASLAVVIVGIVVMFAGDRVLEQLEPMLQRLRENGHPDASLIQGGFDIYAILKNTSLPLLIIGGVVFVIGFCGFCGAKQESRILLSIYSVLLTIIIVVQALGMVVLLGGQEQWKKMIIDRGNEFLVEEYEGSNGTNMVSVLSNVIFMRFNCCTINDDTLEKQTERFAAAKNFNKSLDGYYIPEKAAYYNGPIKIPFTCCKMDKPFPEISPVDEDCAKSPKETTAFTKTACANKLVDHIKEYQTIAILGGACLLLLQVVVLLLAIMICRSTNSKQDNNKAV